MHGVGDRRDEEDEGGGTSCVALKRSPEEDEDWSCLGCRTAGKGPPDTPGELPTRRRRGPRGSRTWWRAGGAVGRAAARHDGADACRRRRVGQRLRQGARPGPLRRRGSVRAPAHGGDPSPMMPADGRATVIDPDGRRTACCSREGLDMGDEECTWLKLVPLLRARPNMIFPAPGTSLRRRPAVSEIERRVFGAPPARSSSKPTYGPILILTS